MFSRGRSVSTTLSSVNRRLILLQCFSTPLCYGSVPLLSVRYRRISCFHGHLSISRGMHSWYLTWNVCLTLSLSRGTWVNWGGKTNSTPHRLPRAQKLRAAKNRFKEKVLWILKRAAHGTPVVLASRPDIGPPPPGREVNVFQTAWSQDYVAVDRWRGRWRCGGSGTFCGLMMSASSLTEWFP